MKRKEEKEKKSDPRQILQNYLNNISKSEPNQFEFIVDEELNPLEQFRLDIAQYPEIAQDVTDLMINQIPFEKIMKKLQEESGIDFEKEKELEEKRYQEIIVIEKERTETFRAFSKELKKFNKNIKIIKRFNKISKKLSKKYGYSEMVYQKLDKIDKFLDEKVKFEPIPEEFREDKDFFDEENWISKIKSLYPEEIVAYTKKDDKFKLLIHTIDFESVKRLIDDLIDEKVISEKDPLFFA